MEVSSKKYALVTRDRSKFESMCLGRISEGWTRVVRASMEPIKISSLSFFNHTATPGRC